MNNGNIMSLKNEMILDTSKEISQFIEDNHGICVDYCDIAYFINQNIGFIFNAIEELEEQ